VKSVDVLYKTAFRLKFDWPQFLNPEVFTYFDAFEKAYNCNATLAISAVLTAVASLVGPDTKVDVGNISSTLNMFLMSICVPGGGKSVAFNKILKEANDVFISDTGKALLVETYTMAGKIKFYSFLSIYFTYTHQQTN